jgi:hypothetical protein
METSHSVPSQALKHTHLGEVRVSSLARKWGAPLCWAALLTTTGCATTAPSMHSLQTPASDDSWEGARERLHRRRSAHGLGSDVVLASTGGLPDFSSEGEELLAPFLACTSPAEFLALQQRVDMPRLVRRLKDWDAVRLGALGPVREDAAGLLNLKRTSFLLYALERYGTIPAEVLSLFIVHTSHDDDLREILFLLARDKRLEETLGLLPSFREALERRGLRPTARADRDFQWTDVGRGLARAGRDALSTSALNDGAAGFAFFPLRGQLPPPYQQALHEAEMKAMERHFSPGNVVLGSFDHLTFGVPLGFYHLVAGTGQGLYSLTRGQYEQATRELAPAALLVALYAGGKGARSFSETRGTGMGLHRGLQTLESRVRALMEVTRQLEERLGVEGLRELARDIQASREAGRFVAVGGVDAALALRAARGDVARAQAMMSRARPETPSGTWGSTGEVAHEARLAPRRANAVEGPGMAWLVDAGVGLTREVVEAKLALAELESTGPRLPGTVAVLEKQRPSVDAPPPGAEGNPRWPEYVAYYERRLGEFQQGKEARAPLRWGAYERMWGGFSRGLAFERLMVTLLREDAKLPRAQRRFLQDFDEPLVETYVGVWKPGTGLRFADVLVIETSELVRGPPRVETFSFKSRNLALLEEGALKTQMKTDAREALGKYGETLDIRRGSLHPLLREGRQVPVPRVRLIYEGGSLLPKDVKILDAAVRAVKEAVPGVEVLFQ